MLGGGATPWANAAAAAGPPAEGHAWGCPKCRAENAAHYKFCLGCGAAQDSAGNRGNYAASAQSSSAQSSPVAVIIVVAVVLALAVAGGVAAFLLLH